MNHMRSKPAAKSFRDLSLSIGDFIRYWGFRRVHGAIWTQLYLSERPLSGADLTRRLKLSKALISPALSELEEWGLIKPADSPDEKSKLYYAVEDVEQVIKHVLKIREQKLLTQIESRLRRLRESDMEELELNFGRLDQLDKMIKSAQLMLDLMLDNDPLIDLPKHFEQPRH